MAEPINVTGLQLEVNGFRYEGWKAIRVTRSLESISGSFSLDVSDRWGEENWPIFEGNACRVLLDGVVVIDGYVDKRRLSGSASSRTLGYDGRDRAGDLVDCSALVDAGSVSKGKWTLKDIDVVKLAEAIAAPFNIKVSVQAGLGAALTKKKIVLQPGDKCFEVISKEAAVAGVLVVSDGAGGILITRGDNATRAAPLVEGVNIKDYSVEYDASDRFGHYLISSQVPATDEAYGDDTRIQAEAFDEDIRRERVLLIRPDKGYNAADSKRRADWEARIRAARAEKVSITVQGWKQPSGALWPLNALTHVKAPRLLGIDGDMRISQVQVAADDQGGTLTQLSLVRPDAFTPEPTATVKSSGGSQWKELDKPPPKGALGSLKAFAKKGGL